MSNKHVLEDLLDAFYDGKNFMVVTKDGRKKVYRFDPKKGLVLIHQAYQTPSRLTINELLEAHIVLYQESKHNRHYEQEECA